MRRATLPNPRGTQEPMGLRPQGSRALTAIWSMIPALTCAKMKESRAVGILPSFAWASPGLPFSCEFLEFFPIPEMKSVMRAGIDGHSFRPLRVSCAGGNGGWRR